MDNGPFRAEARSTPLATPDTFPKPGTKAGSWYSIRQGAKFFHKIDSKGFLEQHFVWPLPKEKSVLGDSTRGKLSPNGIVPITILALKHLHHNQGGSLSYKINVMG